MLISKMIKKKINQREANNIAVKLETFLVDYYAGKACTEEGLMDFLKQTIAYCKITKYSDCNLPTPTLAIAGLPDSTRGQYVRTTNEIQINYLDFISVINNRSGYMGLLQLMTTIGHEMEHYKQNALMQMYDQLPVKKQRMVDKNTQATIEAFKKYLTLNADSIKIINKLFSLHQYFDGVSDDKFVEDMVYVNYRCLLSEKEARQSENMLLEDFFSRLQKNNQVKEKIIEELNEKCVTYIETEQKRDDNYNSINEKILSHIPTDGDDILSMSDQLGEFKNVNDSHVLALTYIIKDYDINEKLKLLKVSIANNLPLLTEVITKSMKTDLTYDQEKKHISKDIADELAKVLEKPDFVSDINVLKSLLDVSMKKTKKQVLNISNDVLLNKQKNTDNMDYLGDLLSFLVSLEGKKDVNPEIIKRTLEVLKTEMNNSDFVPNYKSLEIIQKLLDKQNLDILSEIILNHELKVLKSPTYMPNQEVLSSLSELLNDADLRKLSQSIKEREIKFINEGQDDKFKSEWESVSSTMLRADDINTILDAIVTHETKKAAADKNYKIDITRLKKYFSNSQKHVQDLIENLITTNKKAATEVARLFKPSNDVIQIIKKYQELYYQEGYDDGHSFFYNLLHDLSMKDKIKLLKQDGMNGNFYSPLTGLIENDKEYDAKNIKLASLIEKRNEEAFNAYE